VVPAVHRIAALLTRWLLGTYHGQPRASQLLPRRVNVPLQGIRL